MFNYQTLKDMTEKIYNKYILANDMKSLQIGGSNYRATVHQIVKLVQNWQNNNPCPTRRTTENYIMQLCELFWWGISVGETNEMWKEN